MLEGVALLFVHAYYIAMGSYVANSMITISEVIPASNVPAAIGLRKELPWESPYEICLVLRPVLLLLFSSSYTTVNELTQYLFVHDFGLA